MRRTSQLVAAIAVVVTTGLPATADPGLVAVRHDERGVGVRVGPEAHPIVAVGVDYEGRACVVVGFSRTCIPE